MRGNREERSYDVKRRRGEEMGKALEMNEATERKKHSLAPMIPLFYLLANVIRERTV